MFLENKILVSNTGEGSLTMIDVNISKVEETIFLTELNPKENCIQAFKDGNKIGPSDLLVDKFGNIIIVNSYDDSIIKIELETKQILKKLKVGRFPTGLRRFQGKIYVINSDSNTMSIIDENIFSLIENISVGEKPTDIQVDMDNNKVYISNFNDNSIFILDLNKEDIETIKLKDNPIKLIIHGGILYILSYVNNGNPNLSSLMAMKVGENKVVWYMILEGLFMDMTKTVDKDIIYLTNSEDGCIYKVSILKGEHLKKIYIGGMPDKILQDGENKLFVTNLTEEKLYIIDKENMKIIGDIKVGKEPTSFILL